MTNYILPTLFASIGVALAIQIVGHRLKYKATKMGDNTSAKFLKQRLM